MPMQFPYYIVWRKFMEKKRCAACSRPFRPRPQVPKQSYCPSPECQRERRRRWQRDKLRTDPDYRDNQSRAQRAWLDLNPGYWREYRDGHPEYVKRNLDQQRARATRPQDQAVAKMDVSTPSQSLPSGVYRLRPVAVTGVAKMDSWTVEITLLSATCPCAEGICKEMT